MSICCLAYHSRADAFVGPKVMVHPVATYELRREMHERYMAIYQRYKGVYQAVRGLL